MCAQGIIVLATATVTTQSIVTYPYFLTKGFFMEFYVSFSKYQILLNRTIVLSNDTKFKKRN